MFGFFRKLFSRRSQTFIVIIGLLIVVIFGFVDYLTGPELAFSIFYLLPILLVTWYARRIWGYTISIVSALSWFLADILSPHRYFNLAVLLWNAAVSLGFFLFFSNTLALLKSAHHREKEMARTDPLTGIANSRFFYEQTNLELTRTKRTNEPLTFVYLDVDDFKNINDSLGHSGGDDLLRVVALTLKNTIRAIDILARIGGDEFIIMLPNTGFDEARIAIQRIQKNLLEKMAHDRWPVSFSFGLVTCLKTPDSLDEIIKTADRLMYRAKSRGKNSICHELYRLT
jgi:diguanylate cyclase (GGDEF)-like protein